MNTVRRTESWVREETGCDFDGGHKYGSDSSVGSSTGRFDDDDEPLGADSLYPPRNIVGER